MNNLLNKRLKSSELRQNSLFLLAILIFVSTLFIPRTNTWSITDALTVKLLAYIFFYSFSLILFLAFFYPFETTNNLISSNIVKNLIKKYENLTNPNLESVSQHINIAIIALIVLILVVMLNYFGPVLIPISVEETNKLGLSLYLFHINNTDYFIHLIGGMLPLVIGCFIFFYLVVSSKISLQIILKVGFIAGLSLLLSICFNNILGFSLESEHGNAPLYLGFFISPLVLIIYNSLKFNSYNITPKKALIQLINPIEVCLGTLLALFLFDLFQPPSSTGLYLIGGGGLADGLLLLPPGLIALFYIILAFFFSLIVEIRLNYQ